MQLSQLPDSAVWVRFAHPAGSDTNLTGSRAQLSFSVLYQISTVEESLIVHHPPVSIKLFKWFVF